MRLLAVSLSLALLGAFLANAVTYRGLHDVTAFGAQGDGITDDTGSFMAAMSAAASDGGGKVIVPAGRYLIAGTLEIPKNVTLEGVSPRWTSSMLPLADTNSILLSTANAGNASGAPFILLNTSSMLKGLVIHYPNQADSLTPVAYPWTVRGNSWADNCTLIDVTMTNPYQAIDFGLYPVGRHWVDGVAAQALLKGIYINQCFDVGRLRDVYFGPIWSKGSAATFMRDSGTAFAVGRTDGQQTSACTAEGYNIAFHFFRGVDANGASVGPGSGVMVGGKTIACVKAFYVEDVGDNAGWSFVDSQFEGLITNGSNQKGQMKFTNCSFAQAPGVSRHAIFAFRDASAQKPFFFEHCFFGRLTPPNAIYIDSDSNALMTVDCSFDGKPGDTMVRLGANTGQAVIVRNQMQSGVTIENNAPPSADIQIGLNIGDTTPPVITLLGVTPVTVTRNTTYVDAGATAWDNQDGDITDRLVKTSTVNTSVVGAYTVTYTVSDTAGNAAIPVIRVVNVVESPDTTPP
ncbi:MAG TPA: DUF5011 domain-containing protein, partial [Candidatus Hydrogenedentes bacterium]|nr:DUF5011 domain-containing protein [Candidatus Hydrogenedentota bacterium]